ncbi:MAG: hypothetical protein KKG53_08395 [Proteobacteria bacterium]|nr:hypothetical protein [Pseudomonadota bacterium]
MRLKSIFVLIVVISLTASSAGAITPKETGYHSGHTSETKTYKYRTTILSSSLEPAKDRVSKVVDITYIVDIDYVFKFEMGLLMGEPVVVGWLAYKPTNIQILHYDQNVLLGLFNEADDLYKKIRISEFKMQVWFFKNAKGQRAMEKGVSRTFDTGVAWTPYLGETSKDLLNNAKLFEKFRSYNVPGSPDWDSLFDNIKSKNEAKKFFTDYTAPGGHFDMSPSDFNIIKTEIDTSEVEKYIYNYLQSVEEQIVREKNAERRAEKKQLEAQVSSERSNVLAQRKAQDAVEKRAYAAKSFADQMDDLFDDIEEDDSKTATTLLKVESQLKEKNQRILKLQTEIDTESSFLNLHTNENLGRITSTFDENKSRVAQLKPVRPSYPEVETFTEDNDNTGKVGLKIKNSEIILIKPSYRMLMCRYGHCLAAPKSGTYSDGGFFPVPYYPTVYLINYNGDIIEQYKNIEYDFRRQPGNDNIELLKGTYAGGNRKVDMQLGRSLNR